MGVMPEQQRYDRGDIRRLNAVSVLHRLHCGGPASRAHIAGRLGLTRATVSNIVGDLLAAGLVRETDYVAGAAGRPGRLLGLDPGAGSLVAVEIDLDRIVVVLADFGRETRWEEARVLPAGVGAEAGMQEAGGLVERALAEGRRLGLRCFGICVAWSGLVHREAGELAYGPTSGWEHVPVIPEWEARFGVPVCLENEAHAGAIGLQHEGAHRGVEDLIYLSLGVGMAAGVYAGGNLLRGRQGFSGQVGHTRFADNGIPCSCGRTGCWVTEVGARAIQRKLVAASVLPAGGERDPGWVERVQHRLAEGDAAVEAVLSGVGRQLGEGLSRLVETFNPAVVVLGGRLGALMQPVAPVIEQSLRGACLPCMAEGLRFEVSATGADARQGCLATVLESVLQHPPVGDVRKR